jgi:HSP20 family protein
VLVAERPQGSFTRQLQLGDTVDSENVQATYADGVLHLTLPIVQAAQRRRIEVQTGGSGERQIEVEAEPDEPAGPAEGSAQSGSLA